jgi:hypothetical protein
MESKAHGAVANSLRRRTITGLRTKRRCFAMPDRPIAKLQVLYDRPRQSLLVVGQHALAAWRAPDRVLNVAC